MSSPAKPSNSTPAGDDRNLVPVDSSTAVSFDEKLQVFWQSYRGAIIGVVVILLVVIVGRGLWEHFARQGELAIEDAYAAATTPEKQKAFAAEHPDHSLAGLAHLTAADEAFKAGKTADAIAAYEKAIAVLKDSPLAARAQLGIAVAKAQAGKTPDAIADLKKLADDANQFKAIRTEATYHLTSLAVEAGNAPEAQKYADQLMQIDPASPWTQRGMALRATLPAQPAPAAATPAEATKKEDAGKKIEVKLPGK